MIVGVDDLKDFEDDDLGANVVDARIQKQIERMINEDLKKIKKGSSAYQLREQSDLRRVKESFLNMQKKQKLMLVDLN